MISDDARPESRAGTSGADGAALAHFADLLPSAFRVDSAQTFDALIRQYADIVVVFGVDGVLHFVSGAAEHMLGHTAEQLVGRNLAEFLHPDDRARRGRRRGSPADLDGGRR